MGGAALSDVLLRSDHLCRAFGGVVAVDDVSISVQRGELLGLIGPNGAGKTTIIRLLTGIQRPDSGKVFIGPDDVTRLSTDRRVRRGLALTHQIVQPLHGLSVLENVALAAGQAATRSAIASLFHYGRGREVDAANVILTRLDMLAYAGNMPDTLPLGYLKRLEMARALALNPDVLLLDEPLAGLNQRESAILADLIIALNADGLTIVLVEHNLAEVLRVATRLLVLDAGRVIADGSPSEVVRRPEVRDAYIGQGASNA